MIQIEVYTVYELYAMREDRVGKAAALACYRCLTGSQTKDPKEVQQWMESCLKTEASGTSGFFAAAVISFLGFDSPFVDVAAVLIGTQCLTNDSTRYPLAAVRGFDVYPGLPHCKLPEMQNKLVSGFLRHTIEAQSFWMQIKKPNLVAFTHNNVPNQVLLYENQAGTFVRCGEL